MGEGGTVEAGWGQKRGEAGFYRKELISHNSKDGYMSKRLHRKKARVLADPKSLSYSIGNVFIYKQLEDKP